MLKVKIREMLTSYKSITGTICVNDVLRVNFQNRKCFNLVACTKINVEENAEEQNFSLKYAKHNKRLGGETILLETIVVSSFP